MEDLDPPREESGAAERILHSLQSHGLHWDESVLWQSTRAAAYADALQQLAAGNHLYLCDCSRQMLGSNGCCRRGCQQRQNLITKPAATRVAVPADCRVSFADTLQGQQDIALGRELANFIVKRKDGLDAYQLAVVVDDAGQGVNQVVRGSDLLDSTARQIFLHTLLGSASPHYSHLPVITDDSGQKYSKQNHAPALDDNLAPANLRAALRFLHQREPPAELGEVEQILAFATDAWTIRSIPATLSIAASSIASEP